MSDASRLIEFDYIGDTDDDGEGEYLIYDLEYYTGDIAPEDDGGDED